MEGCWMDSISPDRRSLFPVLLWLSTKGKGFGSSFLRCRTETVNCKNYCGSWAVVVAGQGWGLLREPCCFLELLLPPQPPGAAQSCIWELPGKV